MPKIILLCFFFTFLTSVAQESIIERVDNFIYEKEYNKAKELLSAELKTRDNNDLKDKLGEVYSYQEDWDNAIAIYEELTELKPKNADYQYKYGGVLGKKALSSSKFTALMIVGDMKRAFINAAELNATHIGARWALVDVFISLPKIIGGSTPKAYKYAKELKAISPIDGYFALGYVYEYDDKPEEAKEQYLEGFKLVASYGQINRNQLHYQIGKVSSDYGIELDLGIFHMKKYIKKFSVKDGVPLEWAYYRIAKIYRQKRDKQQATIWIEKALSEKTDFKLAIEEKVLIENL